MFAALAEAAAERGNSELRVSDVLARAGVSRATFYQQFDDLDECLVGAYRAASERLISGISAACGSASDWPLGVLAAIEFSLAFSLESPAAARLLSATSSACDPRLVPHSRLVLDQLVGLLRSGRRYPDADPAMPELIERALVSGAISVVGSRLAAGQLNRLAELKWELTQLLLAPYLGREGAANLVEAAAAPR
jgi:AcrR family transcriptional regulator